MNEGNILLIDLPATITIVAELVDLYNCNFWAETIEEDASSKRQVNRLHKSCPSDLSYMKGRYHLEWHQFWKNRSPDWRRRRDRLHSLEVVIRIVGPASTTLIDFLNGCFMGYPSLMKMTSRSPAPSEVVVVLAAYASHRLLEPGQLVLEVFHRMVKDI